MNMFVSLKLKFVLNFGTKTPSGKLILPFIWHVSCHNEFVRPLIHGCSTLKVSTLYFDGIWNYLKTTYFDYKTTFYSNIVTRRA